MKVTADKVTPGLYIDDREVPHMWFINGQWKGDEEYDCPYAVELAGDENEWHHFRTYLKVDFEELHAGRAITFERLM